MAAGPHPWPLSHRMGEGNRGELPAQLAVSPSWFVVGEEVADRGVPRRLRREAVDVAESALCVSAPNLAGWGLGRNRFLAKRQS